MLQGYELWLVDRQGRRAFRPAAAAHVSEVIHKAREMLAADATLREVGIDVGGERLLTLESEARPPDA